MAPEPSSGPRVVLVAHPEEGARDFARLLVQRRIAACVSLVPVSSVYRWLGELEEQEELLLVVKTTAERLPELEQALADDHPYDVPEAISIDPDHVSDPYRLWLLQQTARSG